MHVYAGSKSATGDASAPIEPGQITLVDGMRIFSPLPCQVFRTALQVLISGASLIEACRNARNGTRLPMQDYAYQL